MASNNPPGASLADDSQGYQPVRIWPPKGRIGRLRYMAGALAVYLLSAALADVFRAGFVDLSSFDLSRAADVIGFIGFAVFIVLVIQRGHDMDLPGWTFILGVIPIVGLYWLFRAGTPGSNRYGAPPPPNTLAVKLVAWGLLALIIIGFVGYIIFIKLIVMR